MRGKKPKERKNYILRTENGTLGTSLGEGKNTKRNRNRNMVCAVLRWCRKVVL